jgi:hypothetical protein
MSFNAFDSVSADATTVTVVGHTAKQSTPTHIDVAVVAVGDESKRVQGPVERPNQSPWEARLPQSDLDEAFEPGEQVLVVGSATDTEGRLEIWGGVVHEGKPEVEAVTTVGSK